jgi:hypothetical protein
METLTLEEVQTVPEIDEEQALLMEIARFAVENTEIPSNPQAQNLTSEYIRPRDPLRTR